MGDENYLMRIEAAMKIDVDLYRSGNSTSARLDHVRDGDVVKWTDPKTKETWVKGLSGGISTFTAPMPDKNWWWIRSGTVVPTNITVTRDRTSKNGVTHYSLRPAKDMKLADYIEALRSFLGVEKLPLERAIELGGRWETGHD